MDTKIKKAEACITNLDNGISRFVWNGNLAKIHENQNKFTTTMILLLFFSIYYQSDPRIHPSAPLIVVAIDTMLLSVSFKPNFIDFASVLNMLALSIGSFYFVVIVFVLFSLSATKLSSNSKLCVMFT